MPRLIEASGRGALAAAAATATALLLATSAALAQTIAPLPATVAPAAPLPPVAGVLTLDRVLAGSARFAPQIVEALQRARAADGRSLAAEGAFDTVFSAEGRSRVAGFYDGTFVEGKVYRPLTSNGGQLYGSYRLSQGDFPIYEDQYYTNSLGEVKVGALFALMRDRFIDDRRFGVDVARREADAVALEGRMVAIGVQRRAIAAYQNWVAAGLRLAVYRELLAVASERQENLEGQVARGLRPAILAVENRQNIVRRRTLVTQTEQQLANAANALSLYVRDAEGKAVVPTAAQLPSTLPAIPATPAMTAISDRPDIQALENRLQQAERKLALERNSLRPRLDVRVEAGKDLGNVAEGGRSRTAAEGIVGVTFSVPLEQRGARGRIAQAEAEIEAVRARRQLLEDQIRIELNGLGIDVRGAGELLSLATQEAELAERLAAAERRRFALGASDLFLVNQREETANDARLRRVEAEFRLAAARAELAAASADLDVLGLR
ncbi:TolC family protein [Sphingomonas sp. SFZ2018-12]|uniref:TolC family protein n=1 Tax=Sphingomonas sp. SFZ2018-12 TaxID=2683197 RepID=UPI001F0F8CF7|nr:TolC family protein [Sphingomonas sp. SFZ2018-12]